MADQEYIDGLKTYIGKMVVMKVERLREEDDDPIKPVHGVYLYDVTGVVEKIDVFQAAKKQKNPLCLFIRTPKGEYLAINVDRISEIDDNVATAEVKQVGFNALSKPAQ